MIKYNSLEPFDYKYMWIVEIANSKATFTAMFLTSSSDAGDAVKIEVVVSLIVFSIVYV